MNRFSTAVIEIRGDIDTRSADEFCRQMIAAADRDVEIRIDSPGGFVDSMTKMSEAIQRHSHVVTTTCTGLAASAAGVLFLLGRKRRIVPDGVVMAHDARCRLGVNSRTKSISRLIAGIIANRTGISLDQVSVWMRKTQYFDAAHSLRLGLATCLAPLSLQTSRPYPSGCEAPKTASPEELRAHCLRDIDERLAQCLPVRKPQSANNRRSPVFISAPPMPPHLKRAIELGRNQSKKGGMQTCFTPGVQFGGPFLSFAKG